MKMLCWVCMRNVEAISITKCCNIPMCVEPCYEIHAEEEHGLEAPLP